MEKEGEHKARANTRFAPTGQDGMMSGANLVFRTLCAP